MACERGQKLGKLLNPIKHSSNKEDTIQHHRYSIVDIQRAVDFQTKIIFFIRPVVFYQMVPMIMIIKKLPSGQFPKGFLFRFP